MIKEIVKHIWYLLLGFAVFGGTLLFAIWLPNLSFLGHTAVSSDYTVAQKLSLFFTSLGAFGTNFTALSRAFTIIVAALFAVNVALIVFYFRKKMKLHRATGLGFIGAFAGLFGIGCAACGSVLLSSVFGVAATASFIGVLPFGGQEFGIVSIIILGLSIFLTIKKMREPAVCNNMSSS